MLIAERLTEQVIGLAITVHRHTGPGLLESVYEQCLCYELAEAGIPYQRQTLLLPCVTDFACWSQRRRKALVDCFQWPAGPIHSAQAAPNEWGRTLPVLYRGLKIGEGFRADLIVDQTVIVEIKSVTDLAPAHEAQLRTYLRMGGLRIGLLMNFNETRLIDGLRRFAM